MRLNFLKKSQMPHLEKWGNLEVKCTEDAKVLGNVKYLYC